MRIVISLDGQEFSALNTFAQRERRDARDQAALIIRAELERRGLIASEHADRKTAQTVGVRDVSPGAAGIDCECVGGNELAFHIHITIK